MPIPVAVGYTETLSGDLSAPTRAPALPSQPRHDSCTITDAAAALQAVAEHRGTTLIDFDETLFLRNSTECFIDCAWPGVLALLLLRLLDLLKPWRFSGGEAVRDNWRAGLIAIAMPWTLSRWKRRAPLLAELHLNRPLLQALRDSGLGETTIVSIGFRRIIAPLVEAMDLRDMRIVGARIFRLSDRRGGKLRMCEDALGVVAVAQALAITDSSEDLPLLERCRSGLLVKWPEARFEPALRQVYLPGQYISRIKHPGQRYILRGILQEDFAFWLLASLALAPSPAWHCAGLLLLLVSFWTVYEQGYADNDRCGARYEASPKLSAEFFIDQMAGHAVESWIWAIASGALGILLLRHPLPPPPGDFLRWAAVLIGTCVLFRIYNRVDKSTRVWLYSGLQFARSAAFIALVTIPPIGAAALGAHIFARWIPYYFYRHGGSHWLNDKFHLMRLILFLWLAALLEFSSGPGSVLNWSAAALLAWNLFRARHELLTLCRTAHRIDRPGSGS